MLYNEMHSGGILALLDYDNTIFDNMVVPEEIDSDDVIDNILFKYGNAPLHSPDPEIMKFYIGRWSKRRLPLWERYYKAITEEYDPLENYDRYELSETSLKHGHKITTDDDLKHGEKITTNDDLKHGEKITTNDDLKHGHKITTNDDLTHGLTVENQISADNASTYQPDNKGINSGKDERDLDETHSGTDERDFDETHSGTDERDFDETHSGTDERDITEEHSGKDITGVNSHIHGNIGVTTSQQMLASELDLIPRLDLIDYISEDFHKEFCLFIYN